jgi:hypothetical protein
MPNLAKKICIAQKVENINTLKTGEEESELELFCKEF